MTEVDPKSLPAKVDLNQAQDFLAKANQLRNAGAKEEPMKANLFHHLPLIFRDQPKWLGHHIAGTETQLKIAKGDGSADRFTDSLVGLTSIEYEPDLRRADRYEGGLRQVREHCAGLLNQGHQADKIVGVLSDSVLWLAFSVVVSNQREPGRYAVTDIELHQIDKVDASDPSLTEARNVVDFLIKYLARRGSRPLNASTIVGDLGFASIYGQQHMAAAASLVDKAFAAKPKYAALIEELWIRFVAIAGSGSESVDFDRSNYANELYLVTLAKLICADVLAERALRSADDELVRILSGEHFRGLGLDNLVEYDYFGWLSESPHVDLLLPVARALQEDLHAYDFADLPAEDVFGHLMAELGKRSHRLLLGQEFTPSWLCTAMVQRLLDELPGDVAPRFVDMCCGSGAMLVAVTNRYRDDLAAQGYAPGDAHALGLLADSVTGFDIDPLAVMLAKVNWVVANRDWLTVGDHVSIPVYHADSLFAGVPFADIDASNGSYQLTLHDTVVLHMPEFLIAPGFRTLFDDLLQRGYHMARAAGSSSPEPLAVAAGATGAIDGSGVELDVDQVAAVRGFFKELVVSLTTLQQAGLNGLWAFILKNSYRPALVAGQFNGIISNPPWLALSKIAANPYGQVLRDMARHLGLSPPGPAHLHTELSTTFLTASIDRYLVKNGVVACILPDSVLNGYQHKPFRQGAPKQSSLKVPFGVSELWRVERGTFKNEAIVAFGRKVSSAIGGEIPGAVVSRAGLVDNPFRVVSRGDRMVWSDVDVESPQAGFFDAGEFRQGADLMPRTLLFHDLVAAGPNWTVGEIDRQAGAKRYLVKDAKKHKEFAIKSGAVGDKYVFDALMSNHLTPFVLGGPDKILLPFVRSASGWRAVSTQELAAEPANEAVFSRILAEISTSATPQTLLDLVETDRSKLSSQSFSSDGYLVVYGAGGGVVCAAARKLDAFDPDKLVIDQTLYWHVVSTLDEALYLTGLFNSSAIEPVIAAFQPQGQQGERHIHRLPVLVTPRFDVADPDHLAVVEATRVLVTEWEGHMADPDVVEKLSPTKALASRRSYLRKRVFDLPAFEAWQAACERIYSSHPREKSG